MSIGNIQGAPIDLASINNLSRLSRREREFEGDIERIGAQIDKVVNGPRGAAETSTLKDRELDHKSLQDQIDEVVDGEECLEKPVQSPLRTYFDKLLVDGRLEEAYELITSHSYIFENSDELITPALHLRVSSKDARLSELASKYWAEGKSDLTLKMALEIKNDYLRSGFVSNELFQLFVKQKEPGEVDRFAELHNVWLKEIISSAH